MIWTAVEVSWSNKPTLWQVAGLLTRPWANEAKAEATQSEAKASHHEAEAKVEDTN